MAAAVSQHAWRRTGPIPSFLTLRALYVAPLPSPESSHSLPLSLPLASPQSTLPFQAQHQHALLLSRPSTRPLSPPLTSSPFPIPTQAQKLPSLSSSSHKCTSHRGNGHVCLIIIRSQRLAKGKRETLKWGGRKGREGKAGESAWQAGGEGRGGEGEGTGELGRA